MFLGGWVFLMSELPLYCFEFGVQGKGSEGLGFGCGVYGFEVRDLSSEIRV